VCLACVCIFIFILFLFSFFYLCLVYDYIIIIRWMNDAIVAATVAATSALIVCCARCHCQTLRVLKWERYAEFEDKISAGASIPPTTKALFSPNFSIFPSPFSISSPFPSSPSRIVLLSLHSPSFPSCRESAPLKPARMSGERCKLASEANLQSPSRHRFWCILREKNSFDSNYYMDFCILKFVKLLNV